MMRFTALRIVRSSRTTLARTARSGLPGHQRRHESCNIRRIVPWNQRKLQCLQPKLARMTIFSSSTPEWHHPSFMEESPIEDKEAWLESVIQSDPRIDSAAYLVVLKHLAKSNESGSPQRAEEWMRRLESKAASQPSSPHLQPTVDCYNAVIKSWANSREDASLSVIRTERWLSKIKKKPNEDGQHENVTANTDSYNAFLDGCSRGRDGRRRAANARNYAKKAQETLEFMISQNKLMGPESPVIPNTESFNYVLRAWTRCRGEPPVAYHVMDILKQMAEYQRQDPENSPVFPNTQSYTMVMDAFAAAAGLKATRCQQQGPSEDRHDPTKNGLEEIEMVEDLLKYMHKLHEDGGLDYVMPNSVTYNVLISAWARLAGPLHPSAPLQAEKVLRKMIALREDIHPEVAPNHLSYTKVMLAWANLGKGNAGKRAQWWLKKLYDEYEVTNDERLRPSLAAYNTVIKAWTRVGRPVNAEMLLVDLIRNEKSEKNPFLKPNSESFSMVIHSWLKAEASEQHPYQPEEGCRRATQWLNELIRRENSGNYGVTTSPELFDCILKAASKCNNLGPDILEFSISIFEKYRESRHRVDFMAYVWVLQVGLNTLGTVEFNDTRSEFIRQLVEDCCADGLLSNLFVRALANGPVYFDGWTRDESARLVNEFFPDWPLPWDWSRNLPYQYHVPRQEDARRTNAEIRLRDRPMRANL